MYYILDRGIRFTHNTSLTPPLFIEVPVPSQESEMPCTCIWGIDFISTIALLDFGNVPTVWYFLFFTLFLCYTCLENIYSKNDIIQ